MFVNHKNILLIFSFTLCQGIPEEELLRQQQALFAQARLEQAQVNHLFIFPFHNHQTIKNISSCFFRLSKNNFSRLKWHKHQIRQTPFLRLL